MSTIIYVDEMVNATTFNLKIPVLEMECEKNEILINYCKYTGSSSVTKDGLFSKNKVIR